MHSKTEEQRTYDREWLDQTGREETRKGQTGSTRYAGAAD